MNQSSKLEEFIIAVRRLKTVSNLSDSDIINIAKKEIVRKPSIPISIFASNLGILETAVKYLKEAFGLTYAKIALMLNRDQRTIWVCYNRACAKNSKKYEMGFSTGDIEIPIEILANRTLSPLCAVCNYLFNLGVTKTTIAKLLNRKVQNIWYAIKKG
ncbi:hypothetical protein K9M79_00095 [Candidatus Woesearchaeota archaeon]|nr:hypothetical protein [Candidatus Woesearchaeota archaeon]